jgi:chaperonin GroES
LNEGEVVAVGPGAKTKEGNTLPMSVVVGDRVLLPEYGGHTVKLGDDEFHLYRDEDILGKFQ